VRDLLVCSPAASRNFSGIGFQNFYFDPAPLLRVRARSQAWETPFVKLCGRSLTTTVLCWKWVPNFYCDPVPSTSDGAAAARGLCFLLVPQGLNSCSKPVGVFFGSIANTSESRAIGMPGMLSSWTCSLTLPGVDLRLVRLRPGMLASLRTRLRDSLAWSSLAPRTLQCCVLLACSAHGLLEQTRSRFHGQFVLYGRVWGCLHPFGRGCETSGMFFDGIPRTLQCCVLLACSAPGPREEPLLARPRLGLSGVSLKRLPASVSANLRAKHCLIR
jgi:hypothetical protein